MSAGGPADDVPAWATAPIEVVPWDPAWPGLAARLVADLTRVVGPALAGRIEHVGSTAVPGLAAKPIVDLLAPVTDVEAADATAAALATVGWEPIPQELDLRPWRRTWVLPDGHVRLAHLHLVAHDHRRARDAVRFRDALRADPALRRRYAALKHELARRHRDDREAYSEAKSDFVAAVLGAIG